MRKKLFTAFLVLLCIVAAGLSYDNVLSDSAPITAAAEQTACKVKSCAERHGMTRLERTPLGQTVEYTWRDGTVTVHCAREFVVFGPRTCTP